MPLAALPIARPDFNRIFLLPPFKINTAGTPHRRITEDIFKCTASPSHPGRILPTRHDIAYSFPHRTFAITLREPMTRMENEIVRRIEISLFYLHPCLERTADFNADFS